jgi:cytochrome c oxidase subunit III
MPATRTQEALQESVESNRLGMWIFLATEILLFGGLFCAYAVYRSNHPEIFVYAHQFLSKTLGGINTLVLICSSFTMAWAVRAAQLGDRKKLVPLLVITILCGFCFLSIKAVEYEAKWKHGLLWGEKYKPAHGAEPGGEHNALPAAGAPGATAQPGTTAQPGSPALPPALNLPDRSYLPPAAIEPKGLLTAPEAALARGSHIEGNAPVPENVQTFFAIYFAMTGLHGLHVIVGMFLISWILVRATRGAYGPHNSTPVDSVGLYWHLVDLIWIYLFPLLYLIR